MGRTIGVLGESIPAKKCSNDLQRSMILLIKSTTHRGEKRGICARVSARSLRRFGAIEFSFARRARTYTTSFDPLVEIESMTRNARAMRVAASTTTGNRTYEAAKPFATMDVSGY